MFKILIVDNSVLFREGLSNLLQQEPGIRVVGQADSISDALELVKETEPDLVLIDADLPDTGVRNSIQMLRLTNPAAQIVLISSDESEELLMHAVRSGARGYLPKNHSLSRFMASIRALERGEAVIPRAMVGRLIEEINQLIAPSDPDCPVELTPREQEVLCELGEGRSNRQIAERLTITENTVKVHVHNILEKLDLRNRRQAARYARMHGLLCAENGD